MVMGGKLVDSVATKQTIATLVGSEGLMDDATKASWHCRMGLVLAMNKGTLDGALEHLRRATASGSTEAPIHAQFVELQRKADQLRERAHEAGVDISQHLAMIADKRASSGPECAMTQWRELVPGQSRVLVLEDVREVQRLCKRAAPGASEEVHWNRGMAVYCGRTCTVCENEEESQAYRLVTDDAYSSDALDIEDSFFFSFDACILIAE